jgi:hypothetical protein
VRAKARCRLDQDRGRSVRSIVGDIDGGSVASTVEQVPLSLLEGVAATTIHNATHCKNQQYVEYPFGKSAKILVLILVVFDRRFIAVL